MYSRPSYYAKKHGFLPAAEKKGMLVNVAGLLCTEEDSISGWVNISVKDLNLKMPTKFDKLESFNEGHNFECFEMIFLH